ncbi:MAG: molecular chaperone HtpG [Muribaculaceae bacterium]|nr:molecular chaperone HtpG [Muribaculaceae bacterium]
MQKGTIGVTTENIFPVIKKFLYSDHEIFLRELVSNAVDASQKLRTLQSFGEFKGETGPLDVRVTIDKEAGTITISDNGVGMTEEDVDRYINQIAFSGAEEFLQKYKDTANGIIGHFGLGFYSAFMVAKKVVINTLSYKEGATAVRWECDGSPEYEMGEGTRSSRGTDIILYIDDESKKFLDQSVIDGLLKKYCRFMPVPVISGKEQEWKDGKMVDTERDKIINATEPQWTKKPSELTDKDYIDFYHELYPGQDDPLFWIHLNVDYPFTLTGILYFPKIKNNLDVSRNRIQLYSNQVYVTDSVEGVVPEFMMLMQGVIDSPDIPLNVSRSYLQADTAVKKISGYITKKVADRLDGIFKSDRAEFEKKWDDIKIFIEYGMLTDAKFCDAALKFTLLKDTQGKYYTLEEYKTLVEASQTDKDGKIVYLYTTDSTAQYSYIKAAEDKGYSVLVMDGQLESHFVGLLEQKLQNTTFVRVDSDVVENLIKKNDGPSVELTSVDRNIMTSLFHSQLPVVDKSEFLISFENMGASAMPVTVTQNEYMRRMKDMAAMQPGMDFYSQLPDSYTLVVNTANPIVDRLRSQASEKLGAEIQTLMDSLEAENKELDELQKQGDAADKSKEAELRKKVSDIRAEQEKIVSTYAAEIPEIKQLLDLALLSNGLLKGAELTAFIERSVDLLNQK